MNKENLVSIVQKLVTKPKGILAIDESTGTNTKAFATVGLQSTEETRQAYREFLVTCPEIENYVSGYIMVDETLRQSTKDGKRFVDVLTEKGIVPGVGIYKGYAQFEGHPGEETTLGLEGLSERVAEYKKLGAKFTKWRSLYHVSDSIPSEDLIKENVKTLVAVSLIVQSHDMVPIIEPEVLIDGDHTIERCFDVTAANLEYLMKELRQAGVYFPGLILKTSMVLSGKNCPVQADVAEVATKTLECLKAHVPSDIGGIVFLSGGQTGDAATAHLNAMHTIGDLPWPLTFSYGRAIQNDALAEYAKNNIEGARNALLQRAKNNSAASIGALKV